MVSLRNACMFGGGRGLREPITAIAIRWLGICLFRYVDDLFAPERAECMQHAMQCIASWFVWFWALVPFVQDSCLSLVVLGVRCELNDSGLYQFPERKF